MRLLWLLGQSRPRRVALAAATLSMLGACATTEWQARPVSVAMGAGVEGAAAPAYQRGKAYLGAGNLGLALEAFREAQRAEPDSIAALNAIAITYVKLGRPDTARRYFERALALEPDSAQTLNNFGRALLEQGRAREALGLLRHAAELEADDPTIAANIAVAQRRLEGRHGRNETARAAGADPEQMSRTTWVERSGPGLQTLVTAAAARASAAGAGLIDPRVVHVVDGRPPARSLPRLQPAAGEIVEHPSHDHGARGRETPRASGPRLEVSNGAGRRHMAARMDRYLGDRGLSVDRLTNADRFGYRHSVIFYRPGFEAEAARVAQMLPLDIALEESSTQWSAVRLRLGGDLLEFDATLPRQSSRT